MDDGTLKSGLGLEVGSVVGTDAVDVVELEEQGPIFCHQVLLEGRRVYEADRERRIDFESETYVRAFDFRPTYEIATKEKAKTLRRWLRKRYDLRTGSVDERRVYEILTQHKRDLVEILDVLLAAAPDD